MSLESGRKLGFAASVISIIVPVIMGVFLVAFYVSLFSSIVSSLTTGITPAASNTAFLFGALVGVIAAGVVSLVGYILFMIAMHRLSQYYNEPIIFKNPLKALIIQIVTAVIAVVLVFLFIFATIGSLAVTPTSTPATPLSGLMVFAVIAVVALIVGWVISIYCGLLYKRAFDKLSEKSGVDNFRTTGLLYLIGTAIPFMGIGGVIVWIAWIFAAIGYRKLTPTAPTSTNPYPPIQTPLSGQTKRCPTCGAENSPDATYCVHCGRQL